MINSNTTKVCLTDSGLLGIFDFGENWLLKYKLTVFCHISIQ
ncbi:hypothetical protein LEP1GSC166_1194 [Leptospira kirschneri]|nr:hypothetical protein LEP1GSC166_1194 [Leptospira kirschneri]